MKNAQRGTVVSFGKRKGYGFLTTGASKKVFFHRSQIPKKHRRDICQGAQVQCQLDKNSLGLYAVNITPVTH